MVDMGRSTDKDGPFFGLSNWIDGYTIYYIGIQEMHKEGRFVGKKRTRIIIE